MLGRRRSASIKRTLALSLKASVQAMFTELTVFPSPGPALETAFTGGRAALVFVPAMLGGMGLYRLTTRKLAQTDETGRTSGSASACAS